MKNLSKILLSVTAVTAVSAAMAVSAMAMTAEYNAESGNVNVKDANSSGASQTVLVFKGDNDTADITADLIKQINQADGTEEAPGNVLDAEGNIVVGDLEDGTYTIRIGGSDGDVQYAEFTVDTQGGGEVQPITIRIGDANRDGSVDIGDAGAIAQFTADTVRPGINDKVNNLHNVVSGADSATVRIGDANLDGSVDIGDAGAVAQFTADTVRPGINDKVNSEVSVEETAVAE